MRFLLFGTMNQLEINNVIREINEKPVVLVELEEELRSYPSIRQVEKQLTNPDNEWQYLYHLENNDVLKDWLEVLSEVYYQIDFKESQDLKPILEKLEFVSQKMLKLIETSINFEGITPDDLKFASDLSKYLHQYKNFHFLTTEVNEFKNEISRIKIELKGLEVNKKMQIILKIF